MRCVTSPLPQAQQAGDGLSRAENIQEGNAEIGADSPALGERSLVWKDDLWWKRGQPAEGGAGFSSLNQRVPGNLRWAGVRVCGMQGRQLGDGSSAAGMGTGMVPLSGWVALDNFC